MSLLIAVTMTLAAGTAASACRIDSAAHQTALVELYTSQGCSSCPPADRWLSQLRSRYAREQVVALALHVGYWDYIGWKDPYAQRVFNERQRALATANGNPTVYTPGVFVQSRELQGWSGGAFSSAVRALNASPAEVKVSLAARVANGSLTIEPGLAPARGAAAPWLFVALTESGLATAVTAGENRGERLRNDHVVRLFSGAVQGAVIKWTLPSGFDPARGAIVAFAQEPLVGGRVLQAVELPLAGC
jgi:hypothetical protein